MVETPTLLITLALALAAALVGALLAVRLHQSVILGYLLAGMAVGPFTPGPVIDLVSVQVLADIGIIFLLFAIGVQLSLRELLQVGRVALAGATLQVAAIMALGYVVGTALGFGAVEALFFGAVISNSSSTVLGKILDEQGEAGSVHGRIALTWSSVQDLSTIVLVVVLTALAGGGQPLVEELLWALALAVVFLAIAVPLGALILPRLFDRVAALRNREIFVLTVAAVALGTAYGAGFFGLPLALGAFIAGVVVGESEVSHQVLGEILPLRDIFAALFFVSVGMLIDPGFVLENPLLVLAALALIVIAKGLLCTAITALARYPARTALLTGVALAQSAEFSFLLARLGTQVDAVTPPIFSLMLAGAAASIVLSPWLHRGALPLAGWLDVHLTPPSLAQHPELADELQGRPAGHAVICGYGRVGRVVARALRRRGFPFVVVDLDQRVVRRLRKQGVVALVGNAGNSVLLERLGLERARVLVVAIPEPLVARQIVDYARGVNPRLDIVARTHSETEREFLERGGVTEAVLGELELAVEMARHTLRRFGVSVQETQAIVQGLRERGLRERGPEDMERPGTED